MGSLNATDNTRGARREEIEKVSEPISDAFREPFAMGALGLRLGVSVGRSLYPLEAHDADGLLRRAHAAMFVTRRAHHAQRPAPRAPQAAA